MLLLLTNLLFSVSSLAYEGTDDEQLFVYLPDGQINVYPMPFVKEIETTASGFLQITLKGDDVIRFAENEYDSISYSGEAKPQIETFLFDKKYNEQLTKDCEPELAKEMDVTVRAIGKWLTPTFRLNNRRAQLLIGDKPLKSSVSRQRMEGDVVLHTALPGYQTLTCSTIEEAVWSTSIDTLWKAVGLTASMLSTNQPSNYPDREGLDKLLDGNAATFFQSTWGSGAYTQKSEAVYIDVALPYSLDMFKVYWQGRDMINYNVSKLNVYTSVDAHVWQLQQMLTVSDGLPVEKGGQTFTTPIVTTSKEVNYIRLEAVAGEKNKTLTDGYMLAYLSWAELRILHYDDDGREPYIISPERYSYAMGPYGEDYTLHMHWLTDECDVPRIDIWTDNGQMPNHIQGNKVADKRLWQKGYLKITGNGVFDDMEDSITIKGRGNTSWDGQNGKSPYNVKFTKKHKPFGLTKGKNWVLQSNKQTGSMMANAIGMKAARLVGTDAANHMIPVDLYINGNYRGHYNFTEKVGIHNNSVDIDEEKGVLFELELNYDELYCFRTSYYSLPTMVKAPDLSEEPFAADAETYFNLYKKDFNEFVTAVKKKDDYEYMIDIPSFARFLMLNVLILNYEIDHPKCFLYKENVQDPGSIYRFGPIWDLDWAFGYEDSYTYYQTSASLPLLRFTGGMWLGTPFFQDMLDGSEEVEKEYYRVWCDFVRDNLPELLDYVQDYYDFAAASLKRNRTRWSSDGTDYAASVAQAQQWLTDRCEYIMSNIKTFDIDPATTYQAGDVNGDGRLSAADVLALVGYLLTGESNELLPELSDLDKDDAITESDLLRDVELVMGTGIPKPNIRAAKAQATLEVAPFEAGLGEVTTASIRLTPDEDSNDDPYMACDLLLTLPQGMELQGAKAVVDEETRLNVETATLPDGRLRLLVWSPECTAIPAGEWLRLSLYTADIVPEEQRILTLGSASLFSEHGEEYRLGTATTSFTLTTSITPVASPVSVQGGQKLTIHAIEPAHVEIYTPAGLLVASVDVETGCTQIELPDGLYIVGGKKIIINGQ